MYHNYHLQRRLEHLSNLYIAIYYNCGEGFPGSSAGKESTCNTGNLGLIPGLGRALEESMATHSSILAWRSPTDRGACGLQSMGSQRVGHD